MKKEYGLKIAKISKRKFVKCDIRNKMLRFISEKLHKV